METLFLLQHCCASATNVTRERPLSRQHIVHLAVEHACTPALPWAGGLLAAPRRPAWPPPDASASRALATYGGMNPFLGGCKPIRRRWPALLPPPPKLPVKPPFRFLDASNRLLAHWNIGVGEMVRSDCMGAGGVAGREAGRPACIGAGTGAAASAGAAPRHAAVFAAQQNPVMQWQYGAHSWFEERSLPEVLERS